MTAVTQLHRYFVDHLDQSFKRYYYFLTCVFNYLVENKAIFLLHREELKNFFHSITPITAS